MVILPKYPFKSQSRLVLSARLFDAPRKLVHNTVGVMVHCAKYHNAHLYYEWPGNCHGWALPELKELHQQCQKLGQPLKAVYVQGCRLGLKTISRKKRLYKRWKILTTDERFAQKMGKYRHCNHKQSDHAVIQGRETEHSGKYPQKMVRRIVRVWSLPEATGSSSDGKSLRSSSSSGLISSSSFCASSNGSSSSSSSSSRGSSSPPANSSSSSSSSSSNHSSSFTNHSRSRSRSRSSG